ncbi:RloB [Campylobacter sp. MIT 12-5580]|uniref:RloB family protein n=1 Tax=Campylobacter sp. MIT 12-5580 TaxID=2040651 RepID=UPI0010F86DCE|nr:RloB family protein [Campylobacter sp. MIT 12-5580]TKX29814.1 RloB [Campylobacter sp. MIT 12-5580]
MGTDNLFKKRQQKAQKQPTRATKNLSANKVLLIVCEGEKTEKNYFEALKHMFKVPSVQVVIDAGSGSAPNSVVKYAKEKLDKNPNVYDEIYCVFDKDKHAKFNNAHNTIKNIQESNKKSNKDIIFKGIVSDPCFEFWILLHFTKTTQQFGASGLSPCDEVQKHKKFLKDYKKDYDFTKIIESSLETAIKNANEVNALNESQSISPYTQVVYLVQRIKEIGKNND